MKASMRVTCAATNGGSFPFGANACRAGIFWKDCTTPTKQFR